LLVSLGFPSPGRYCYHDFMVRVMNEIGFSGGYGVERAKLRRQPS
jgi:hypothetical protein